MSTAYYYRKNIISYLLIKIFIKILKLGIIEFWTYTYMYADTVFSINRGVDRLDLIFNYDSPFIGIVYILFLTVSFLYVMNW